MVPLGPQKFCAEKLIRFVLWVPEGPRAQQRQIYILQKSIPVLWSEVHVFQMHRCLSSASVSNEVSQDYIFGFSFREYQKYQWYHWDHRNFVPKKLIRFVLWVPAGPRGQQRQIYFLQKKYVCLMKWSSCVLNVQMLIKCISKQLSLPRLYFWVFF